MKLKKRLKRLEKAFMIAHPAALYTYARKRRKKRKK